MEAQWLMPQQKPDDFVIVTGKQYSVKYFINIVAKELDMKKLLGEAKVLNEKLMTKIII